ncbi:carbohydrate ABC transporter permease [Paenibacillus whitsoniae]|uniref:Carbohydrate ABC transporter permease n=1 Tax=Paenibacillus whitsoniae TaxID=2496558 RepID=A0A430JIL2_9BACL|nr:carbohydrate ABC transporter permease [Paenibacillus whitsoniae]RTE10853.1 carbohydrate ABC transporter permease [Paenibacillus whitsoniae]
MHTVHQSRGDKLFDAAGFLILLVALVTVAYPLYFIVIASFSNPSAVSLGEVILLPKGITLEGYSRIVAQSDLWIGYRNTIAYTIIGTFLNVALTVTGAYALSRKDLVGRNVFMGFIAFTMFFSGGLIPTYLLIKGLGLYNTFWVMVIPGAISVWNLIIARTYFQTSLPEELWEAAVMDGCSNFQYFFKVVLPLSQAIIAVLVLFYAVGHWNEFFNGLIYLKDRSRYPLQLILRDILIQTQISQDQVQNENANKLAEAANLMKYGIIIVSSLPVLILYPFIQKYFVKGVMVGAIKG